MMGVLRVLVAVVCVWAGITLLQAPVVEPQKLGERPTQFPLAKLGQPIAGIPHEKALEIYHRHAEELHKLPGVESVSFTAYGLMVATANPAALPPAVEGLPVIPIPPHDPRTIEHLDPGVLPSSEPFLVPEQPQDSEKSTEHKIIDVFARRKEELLQLPDVLGVLLDHEGLILVSDRPEKMPKEIEGIKVKIIPPPAILPPPPGVIVLRPGGVREQADSCPNGFREKGIYRWRFCLSETNPEPIPALMNPPIAGIPYEEAEKIHKRHALELMKLPGVNAVGLGSEGIEVSTDQPGLVPSEVEGLPVKTLPRMHIQESIHTETTPLNPLHGGAVIGDLSWANEATGGGVVLSQGKPWMVSAAHLINDCEVESLCPPCDLPANCPGPQPRLNFCQHYEGSIITQPPQSNSRNVGRSPRWTLLTPGGLASGSMAFFVDNDTTDGNGSLSVDRRLENYGAFSGLERAPVMDDVIVVVSGIGAVQHTVQGRITYTSLIVAYPSVCTGSNNPITYQDQVRYHTSSPLLGGMSGSLVLDGIGGQVFGMHLWAIGVPNQPQTFLDGGGTKAAAVKSVLGFDAWYGTASVLDQTIGIFRPSTAQWVLDNGNGHLDPCASAPSATQDGCLQYGTAGNVSVPLAGDWDANGSLTVGVYRTDTNPQQFQLRNANSPGAAHLILNTGPPSFGYQPVAGKWAGLNTVTKVGVFKADSGEWYLDNGDFVVGGCASGDICFNTSAWTRTGDKPLAGDWDGNGTVTVGVFRPSDHKFYLSNHLPPTGVEVIIPTGPPSFGYQPVAANWTGTGGTKLGVFQPSSGQWYLVSTGLVPSNCATDLCVGPFGGSGDQPVAFGASVLRAN